MIPGLLRKSTLGTRTYSVPTEQLAGGQRSTMLGGKALARSLDGDAEAPRPAGEEEPLSLGGATLVQPATGAEDGAEDGSWPSENAEASAMADARDRGESLVIANALNKVEEETVKKTLPPLNQVIPKIPQEVQDALEDIFRAKWTRVMRVKKRDLKNP